MTNVDVFLDDSVSSRISMLFTRRCCYNDRYKQMVWYTREDVHDLIHLSFVIPREMIDDE